MILCVDFQRPLFSGRVGETLVVARHSATEEEPTLSDGMLCLSESGNKYSWESFFLHSKPFMRCNEQSSGHLEA